MDSDLALRQRALDGSSSDEFAPSSPSSFWGDPSPEVSESRNQETPSTGVSHEVRTSVEKEEGRNRAGTQTDDGSADDDDDEVFDVRSLLLERHQQRRKQRHQHRVTDQSSEKNGPATNVKLPSVEEALESGAERAQNRMRKQEQAAAQAKIAMLGADEVHHVSAGGGTGESSRQKRKPENGI